MDPTHDEAARTLRRHTRCLVLADGTPMDCRFIVDGTTGELVLGAEPALLDAGELVLGLPDDSFEAEATVLLHHRPAHDDRWTDRHLAYHPESRATRWIRAKIDSVKLRSGEVVPGERLGLVNPLTEVEPELCKRLNADRDALRTLCRLMTGTEPEQPVGVGVDRLGVDVRARFGIIRLDLPAPCQDPDEARRVIDALIENAR
jgi:hypothetical protein